MLFFTVVQLDNHIICSVIYCTYYVTYKSSYCASNQVCFKNVDLNSRQTLISCLYQENAITFVDCENLANLRVLRLSQNRLTSIHGLGGAVNLTNLELSHNCITRTGEHNTPDN